MKTFPIRHLPLTLLLWSVLLLGACAQQVEDIDRTQPNKTLKSDLEGTWYMMQTVTDVPSTSGASFVGETSKTEKIIWEIQENYLIGRRSYPLYPGSEDTLRNDPEDAEFTGNPIAVYQILSHFDVQRDYNPSTGEQGNVILENISDRPWFERDYMRVDWSRNLATNFDFLSEWFPTPISANFIIEAEREESRSLYFERDQGKLAYFDIPGKMLLEPDLFGCLISSPWYVWSTEDCASAEIEMVTSFARTEPRRDYEPLPYNDHDMNRFGYFRSERYVFDPQRGPLESARTRLANRHNIWQESYRKDNKGNLLTNDEGQLIPIPVEERSVRTVPYYLSTNFPADELLQEAARDTIAQWNEIGKNAVSLILPNNTTDVFALCHNPVAQGDHESCGEQGFSPRIGDLRYSTLHWVESDQLLGPLGYGPVANDPETGEILSARAYVYGSSIQTYATYGVDVIRFMNGDLENTDLIHAQHVREQVLERSRETVNLDKIDPSLKETRLLGRQTMKREHTVRREEHRRNLRSFDRDAVQNKLTKAKDNGLSAVASHGEFQKALSSRLQTAVEDLNPDQAHRHDPNHWFNPTALKEQRRKHMKAVARGLDGMDMIDPNVVGIARAYEGRTDYAQIWKELRAEIFRSTALHEVGHTVGLRHNFQGTFDSLNFFPEYWEARQENLETPQNMFDLYKLNATTENQLTARMREYQYSSIMDYGVTFNTDIHGLGNYDRAAFTYAYTAGAQRSPECDPLTGVQDGDACLNTAPGFVQIFKKRQGALGQAGEILTRRNENNQRFDDLISPSSPYLERWHYTTFIQSFPQIEDAFDREWMRMEDYIAARDEDPANAPVRVPYLFCSDEWTEALLSCQVFDHGADMFEMTQTIINDYRAYYYFTNFKRDRLLFDPFNVLFRYFYRTFLPLSDFYQSWYLAPEGYDETQDTYTSLAVNMGFNFFTEVIATPPYGSFCTGKDGNLINLTEEVGGDPQQSSEFYLSAYCDREKPFYEIKQGDGRRRFTTYDIDSGYHFDTRPLEAGHYWATLGAFWALVDPEAFVLGSEADVGTFAISYYDIFADEIDDLAANIINEDYTALSPLLEIDDPNAERREGTLHYRIPAPSWNPDERHYFNPANGQPIAEAEGPSRAVTALCQPCNADTECNGHTGALGGTYCQPIDNSGTRYCLQDCTNDSSLCAQGHSCDSVGNCVPDDQTCDDKVPACTPETPRGACPSDQTCNDAGECVDLWPIVESNSTFSLFDDFVFYGMLYTTSNFSTRYNDRLFVFRMNNEENAPGEGFETISFVDPISGDTYGYNVESCEEDPNAPTGGPVGLCEPCENHAQCAGYTGNLGGSYCQPLQSEDDEVWFCLQDCTEDENACGAGRTCNDAGNCVPTRLSCDPFDGACSPDNPLGSCEENSTCVEGTCVSTVGNEPSPRCRFGQTRVTSGEKMIRRGQTLSTRYNETLDAYWSSDGNDPVLEETLYYEFLRARFEMESHIERINTIRAVYDIFGKVY